MTPDKRQELERLRDAILQEQDRDKLIKLLEKLNEVVSDLNCRNTVGIASRALPKPRACRGIKGK